MIKSIVRSIARSQFVSVLGHVLSGVVELLKLPLTGETFTRSDSSKLVEDYRGVLVSTGVNIPAFKGARLATTVADGAELGSELVSNGDFTSGGTGWNEATPTRGDVSFSAGTALLTNDYSNGSSIGYTTVTYPCTLPAGQYRLSFDLISQSGGSVTTISATSNSDGTGGETLLSDTLSNGSYVNEVTLSADKNYLALQVGTSADSAYREFDNVSIKSITPTNLATDTLGNALLNKADYSTARPVSGAVTEGSTYHEDGRLLGALATTNGNFASWTGDDPNDWTVFSEDANNYVTEDANGLRLVSDGGGGTTTQSDSLLNGALYYYKVVIHSVTGAGVKFSSVAESKTFSTVGTHTGTFTASGADFGFLRVGATDTVITSIEYWPAYTRPIALTCTTGGTTGASLALDEADMLTTVTDGTAQFSVDGYATLEGYDNDPQLTNKCTTFKYNPTATTNLTPGGTATAAVVADDAEIAAGQLNETCTLGDVFELVLGAGEQVVFGGQTGNTNTHSARINARLLSGDAAFGVGSGATALSGTSYAPYKHENVTPLATDTIVITSTSGGTVRCILPTLVEAASIDAPIINHGGDAASTVDRPADNLSFEAPSNLTAQKGAVELVVTPSESGQATKWLWSTAVDGSNEFYFYAAASTVVMWKEISGSGVARSFSYTHAADTTMHIQGYYDGDDFYIRAADYGDDISAIAFQSATNAGDMPLGTAVEIGARSSSNHFAGDYITCNTYGSKEEAGW